MAESSCLPALPGGKSIISAVVCQLLTFCFFQCCLKSLNKLQLSFTSVTKYIKLSANGSWEVIGKLTAVCESRGEDEMLALDRVNIEKTLE